MIKVFINSFVIYSFILGVNFMINFYCLYFIFFLSGLSEIFFEMYVVVNWFFENIVK